VKCNDITLLFTCYVHTFIFADVCIPAVIVTFLCFRHHQTVFHVYCASPCVCVCVSPSVMLCPWYLWCAVMDFRQTFVGIASWAKNELIRFWVKRLKVRVTAWPSMLKTPVFGVCFRDFSSLHWCIFSKLLLLLYLGTTMNCWGFEVKRWKFQGRSTTSTATSPAGSGVQSLTLWHPVLSV